MRGCVAHQIHHVTPKRSVALDPSATEKRWAYKPPQLGGQAISTRVPGVLRNVPPQDDGSEVSGPLQLDRSTCLSSRVSSAPPTGEINPHLSHMQRTAQSLLWTRRCTVGTNDIHGARRAALTRLASTVRRRRRTKKTATTNKTTMTFEKTPV